MTYHVTFRTRGAGEELLAGPSASVLLLDGTAIYAKEDTRFRVVPTERNAGVTVVLQGEGKLYCDVARRDRPLLVVASPIVAQVVGTSFSVERSHSHRRREGGESQEVRAVAVFEGSVTVLDSKGVKIARLGAQYEFFQAELDRAWNDWQQ